MGGIRERGAEEHHHTVRRGANWREMRGMLFPSMYINSCDLWFEPIHSLPLNKHNSLALATTSQHGCAGRVCSPLHPLPSQATTACTTTTQAGSHKGTHEAGTHKISTSRSATALSLHRAATASSRQAACDTTTASAAGERAQLQGERSSNGEAAGMELE